MNALDGVLEAGQKRERLPGEILDDPLSRERQQRFKRRVATHLQLLGMAHLRRLEDFDFSAQMDVSNQMDRSKLQIDPLSTLRFLHQGENILLLGPPGVGKSHLAIAWE